MKKRTTAAGPESLHLIGDIYQVGSHRLTDPGDCAVYLLKTEEPVLIDCGLTKGFPLIRKNIESLGVSLKDIRLVIGTHGHFDHIQAANLFRRQGIRFALHEDAVKRRGNALVARDQADGFPRDGRVPLTRVDMPLKDRAIIRSGKLLLEVIHAPGHTAGGICLRTTVNHRRLLFMGDLFSPHSLRYGSSLPAHVRTLRRLLRIRVDMLLWAHGHFEICHDAKRRLRERLHRVLHGRVNWAAEPDAGMKYRYGTQLN